MWPLLLVAGGLVYLEADKPRRKFQDQAQGIVNRLAAVVGCDAPPVVATRSVPNAASDGRRILINFTWFDALVKRHCRHGSCVTSVAVGVLAHELAHHLHCDARCSQHHHAHFVELRADHVAGALMRRIGIRPEHFEAVLIELSYFPTYSHPGWEYRVSAVRNGYAGWN